MLDIDGLHDGLDTACCHNLMVPLDRDGVIGVPSLDGHHLAIEQLELGKLVLKAVGVTDIDDMSADLGDKDDVIGVAHTVHRHQRTQQGITLHIVDERQQSRGRILAGEVSLHHGHIAMIIDRSIHPLPGPVDVVGAAAVKHPEHRHELTHADEQAPALALDDVGTLKIG